MKARKKIVATQQAPQAIGPYSQGIVIGDLVFLSGQIPIDPATGALAAGGIKEQTGQALKNLGAVLKAAGLGYQDVMKTTVYMKDLSGFAEMNEAYGRCFLSPFPSRTTIQAAALPMDALIEIEAVAVKRDLPGGVPL